MDRPYLKSLALIAVAAPLLLTSTAMATAIIDTFDLDSNAISTAVGPTSQTQNVTVAGNAATRTLKIGKLNPGEAEVVVNAGQLGYVSAPADSGQGSVEYSNFVLDASTTPYLQFTIGSTLGQGFALIGLTSTTASGLIATEAVIPANISAPTNIHFDLRTFPGYQAGFLPGVTSLAIAFRGGSDGSYFLKVNEIALITEDEFGATLPEPSLIALALPAAALIALRRKSRAKLR